MTSTNLRKKAREAATAIFLDERVLSLAAMMAVLVLCAEFTVMALYGPDTLHEQSGLFVVNIFLLIWVAAHAVAGFWNTWG
jgi:hypothetical protein